RRNSKKQQEKRSLFSSHEVIILITNKQGHEHLSALRAWIFFQTIEPQRPAEQVKPHLLTDHRQS
ncbi:AGAP007750-PA, partial [Anopheles gambiae str. PEST]